MNQIAREPPSQTRTGDRGSIGGQLKRRRCAARALVLVAAAAMVLPSAPTLSPWLAPSQQVLSWALDCIGLRQGTWSMFAPDPVLNNGWFTAEIQHVDGTQSQWNSPYWVEADSSDKFLRFRFLNYYNRLRASVHHGAGEDFADYLAHRSDVPVESVKLYHTRMRLILPDDGTLPKRDEVTWIFSSEPVAQRTYVPNTSKQTHLQQRSSQP